jgi:hypothetical protein
MIKKRILYHAIRKHSDDDLPELTILEKIRRMIKNVLSLVSLPSKYKQHSKFQKQSYKPRNILSPVRSGFTDEDLPEIAIPH